MLFIIFDSDAVFDCTEWLDPSWLPSNWFRDDCYVVYVGY